MRSEFPIEQLARHASQRFQYGFARQAMRLFRSSDASAFEATADGLLVRAQSEDLLDRSTEILREVYGEDLRLPPPRVRYMRWGRRWYEPVMLVRVRIIPKYREIVRDGLLARGAMLLEEYSRTEVCVLRAELPLRDALGFGKHFSQLTNGTGFHWTWLDRYRPMEDPPDGQAA
jgi:predicted membrane GTPase involved in stress response